MRRSSGRPASLASEWGLRLGQPFALSNYSFVAPVGDDAVLKVRPADDDESEHEAEALELWDGEGAVRLLRQSRERRALLIERARPGTDLAAIGEARPPPSPSSSAGGSGGPPAGRSAGSATTSGAG